jgi:DNA-directed RNA polymerase subunit M/transcription elongation factor TFIIS
MKFCAVCENMLYLKITSGDDDLLLLYCRKCGSEEEMPYSECVSRRVVKVVDAERAEVSKYAKFDPTLPHITKKCPNPKQCENDDILYIRTDDDQLKYTYLCPVCDHNW